MLVITCEILWTAYTSAPIGLTQDDEKPWLLAYALLVTNDRNNQTKDFASVIACADKKPFHAISDVSSNLLKKNASWTKKKPL